MLREDWARRRVVARASLAVVIFMSVWCAGWWGAIALIGTLGGEPLRAAVVHSWTDAAGALFIMLGGVAGLLVLVAQWRAWRRYGHATLLIDTLPGFLGESFRGRVETRLAARPVPPIEVTLACEDVRLLTMRGAGGRRITEETFEERWSESIVLDPGRLVVTRDAVSIPIDIAIPSALPECARDARGNGTRWVLRVSGGAQEGRRDFFFAFEVPVFARRYSSEN